MNTFKMDTNNIHEYTDCRWLHRMVHLRLHPYCTRTVPIYPNQKPWFNSDIRGKIRKRWEAFRLGDRGEYKESQYELQKTIKAAKRAHSQKHESLYLNNNMHVAGGSRQLKLQEKHNQRGHVGHKPSRPSQFEMTSRTLTSPQNLPMTPRTQLFNWHKHRS